MTWTSGAAGARRIRRAGRAPWRRCTEWLATEPTCSSPRRISDRTILTWTRRISGTWPAQRFEYFAGKDFATFSGSACRFEIVKVELTFGGNFVLDNPGRMIARGSPRWYERHAASIFPALDIRAHLRARK